MFRPPATPGSERALAIKLVSRRGFKFKFHTKPRSGPGLCWGYSLQVRPAQARRHDDWNSGWTDRAAANLRQLKVWPGAGAAARAVKLYIRIRIQIYEFI